MATIESTLDDFMKMDYNTREMMLEILQKRQIEARRKDIARSARQAIKSFRLGELKVETADELIARLNTL